MLNYTVDGLKISKLHEITRKKTQGTLVIVEHILETNGSNIVFLVEIVELAELVGNWQNWLASFTTDINKIQALVVFQQMGTLQI